MEKITIELKFYPDDADQKKAVIEAARMTAKHIHATAMLVASSQERMPEIAMWGDNFFEGRETIELADDFE